MRTSKILAAGLICFGIGGCCWLQSETMGQQASSLPRMTCAELVKNGPGGHRFVRLTDVRLCSRGGALYRDMDAAMEMYIPIHSRREKEPEPADLSLLLEVHDDRDRTALLREPDVGELNCQVDRTVAGIGPSFVKVLESQYPGIRMGNLRLVSVGMHEPTQAKAERTWWYGALAFLLGAGLVAWGIGDWWRTPSRRPDHAGSADSDPIS